MEWVPGGSWESWSTLTEPGNCFRSSFPVWLRNGERSCCASQPGGCSPVSFAVWNEGLSGCAAARAGVHLPVAQLLTGSSLFGHRHWHSCSAANNVPTDWVQFAVVTDIGSQSGVVFLQKCALFPFVFLVGKMRKLKVRGWNKFFQGLCSKMGLGPRISDLSSSLLFSVSLCLLLYTEHV